MTTSLAFRVLLSHFLPGLMAIPGAVAATALLLSLTGSPSCSSFTCCPDECMAALLKWAQRNVALSSLGALVLPLMLGLLLDDWRHGFPPCREDKNSWWDAGIKNLAGLPNHLFRFMYDEYYYFVEFDGNSFLAIGASWPLVTLNYLRSNNWHWNPATTLLLLAPPLLCWFLWVSWKRGLKGFFDDVGATASQYEKMLRERPPKSS